MIDCASDNSDEVHESGDSITGETHDYMTKYLTIIVFFSVRGWGIQTTSVGTRIKTTEKKHWKP